MAWALVWHGIVHFYSVLVCQWIGEGRVALHTRAPHMTTLTAPLLFFLFIRTWTAGKRLLRAVRRAFGAFGGALGAVISTGRGTSRGICGYDNRPARYNEKPGCEDKPGYRAVRY
jgi:hypothetical protein